MVYLGTDTVVAKECMYAVCKVQGSAVLRHCLDVTFWREYEYFGGVQVQLYCVEEIKRVGLRVVKYLLDGVQPVLELVVV